MTKETNNEICKYNMEQATQILCGIKKGLDVSIYAKLEYNEDQMREIRFRIGR